METTVENPDINVENKVDAQGRIYVGKPHAGKTFRIVGERVIRGTETDE